MFAAAFAALGLPHTYEARRVDEQGLAHLVDALRRGEIAGMNLTIPHKAKALALADERRAKEVLARQAGITDPKILDISYNDFRALSPADITPTAAAADSILKQFPDASRNQADYIDTSILDGLRRDGVFAGLQQKYRR